ncbi:C40 family peptidase [Paenibacillus sp. GCM10023252]|uniref:C40 family peptidase n=1 Tax=Paenibacillus sp. GCM10023252 TaxID=3252649 RepID=UPI00361B6B0D
MNKKLTSAAVQFIKLGIAACIMAGMSGCGTSDDTNRNEGPRLSSITGQDAKLLVADELVANHLPIYRDSGHIWVPLKGAAKALGLQLHEDGGGHYAMGQTNPNYNVQINHKEASAGDKVIRLPEPLRELDNEPYMTMESLSALLGTPLNWDETRQQIVMTPITAERQSSSDGSSDGATYRGLAAGYDATELIQYARSFEGTPYEFGTGDYERTRKFDCSTFTAHVFERYGINLPRTSLSQSQVGERVEKDELQAGDLMFFFTPGRYESNEVVGHVGIYAGDGNMIHTYGDPGVIFDRFDSYWQGRFLFGRRVAN